MSKPVVKLYNFSIDDVHKVKGYCTDPGGWNGWGCPGFTFEEAMKLVNSYHYGNLSYDKESDQFVCSYNDIEDVDTWVGRDVITEHGVVKLYLIGAYGWCWERSNLEEGDSHV